MYMYNFYDIFSYKNIFIKEIGDTGQSRSLDGLHALILSQINIKF